MAYNTTAHEITEFTLFELTFWKKENLPPTLATTPSLSHDELVKLWERRHENHIQIAREKIQRSKEKNKRIQDSRIVIPQEIYEPGDLTWMRNDDNWERKLE